MVKKGKSIKCEYCGRELKKGEITYVEGLPYCKDCVSEAEIYTDLGEEEEDDDDDDDDNDY